MASLSARALSGLPELRAGDDLAALIAEAAAGGEGLRDGQLVSIAHKVVSKAEGAVVSLGDVQPGERARELAERLTAEAPGHVRDPRVVQVVLDQSAEVVRAERGVLICRTHHGLLCANAGVDASNATDQETLIVLPRDPDGSARRLRARLRELSGARLGVLISDSFGRAWRHGQLDVAIGLAGMQPLEDWRGRSDTRGMALRARAGEGLARARRPRRRAAALPQRRRRSRRGGAAAPAARGHVPLRLSSARRPSATRSG